MCPTGTTRGSDFRTAFDALDVDHDGKISRDDLRTFYAGFSGGGGISAAEDVIGSMISAADANKDGYVEYDEFERVLRGGRDQGNGRLGAMEEAFRVMDRDGDGRVGREDLKSYLKWAGFDASDEDIKAMIRLGGGDQNQGVTYDDLLNILAL